MLKMESTGQIGLINLSKTTHSLQVVERGLNPGVVTKQHWSSFSWELCRQEAIVEMHAERAILSYELLRFRGASIPYG